MRTIAAPTRWWCGGGRGRDDARRGRRRACYAPSVSGANPGGVPVRGVRPSGTAQEGSAGHAAADEFSVAAGSLGGSLSAQLLELEQLATLGRLLGVAAHELANPLSFVHGNIGLVERHATELWELVNAAEAIDGPGTIRVTLSPLPAASSSGGGQHARVAVADGGPGVPASQGERIFLPFVTTKGERAIGLGLAIGRVIARAHGGELRLDDECAVGARFLLDLPAAAASLPTGSP